MARNSARHAGRTLILFVLGVAVLYGLVAVGGNWKPALGLDLQGGTRVTMIAEGTPSKENLETAAEIIDARVNARGVSEAEVTTQGDNIIIVEVPGDTSNSLLDTVKRTAQLRFRTVACTSIDPGPCATAGAPTAPGTQDPGTVIPSDQPSEEPSATPTEEPATSPTAAPSESASPKNRPPFAADGTESPSPTESPAESPSGSPSESPSAPADEEESPAAAGLAFITNPPQEAIDAFNAYTCPAAEPPEDDPETWLVTCGSEEDAATKYLLSPAVIEGTELDGATAGAPSAESPQWQVNLELGGDGRTAMADLSGQMAGTGQRFAIVLDGLVLSAPEFTDRIGDGNARITGSFDKDSAQSLATSLKYGSLPIAFERDGGISTEQIGPSLAGNQLQAGLTAGLVGLILVMLYCLVYYRGLGLVVLVSLAVAAAITYALVLLLGNTAGFTLTLPGIAGLIIGVGITADSFIIFFERIRDEMREGKSMRVAVETGWRRARKTRLAANVVSLLSASVLYLFATGVVKGFGFALGLSTAIDLAILFWFTKPMVTFLARFPFFNGGGELSGLSANTLGMDRVAKEVKA